MQAKEKLERVSKKDSKKKDSKKKDSKKKDNKKKDNIGRGIKRITKDMKCNWIIQ